MVVVLKHDCFIKALCVQIFHRKAEDVENDALSSEEQEECKNYLRKTRDYLIKILDDSDSDLSVVKKVSCRLFVLSYYFDTYFCLGFMFW